MLYQLSYVGVPFCVLEERGTAPIVWVRRRFGKGFRCRFLQAWAMGASMASVQPETALLFWWLNILTKKRYDQVVELCGSLDAALARLSPELMRQIGMRQDSIEKTFARIEEFDPASTFARLQKLGVGVLSIEDEEYPRLLKETADPPVFLSYRGDLSVLDHPCVAVVGTREMSPYGKRLTEWITPDFVRAGCTVVSGLAFGVDAVAAESTMDAGGKTVAVLGSGLGAVSPKTHERLAEQIVKNGGLVISEYPFAEIGQPFMFPARNRIVAGLSLATVVVEAPAQSGALITARLALEENRDVFACPGQLFDPNFEGNHRLIAQSQAQLLISANDVLKTLGIVASSSSASVVTEITFASPDEETVHAALTTLPTSMDDLVAKTGKSAGELAGILTMLELAGAASKVGAGWVRS